MDKILSWLSRENGFEENIDAELVSSLSLVALIISLVGFFVNFLMRLNHLVSLIVGVSIIVYFTLYKFSKKEKYQTITKWTLIVFSITLLNLLWYYNNGSRGPALYIFVIIYSFFILVFSGKQKIILTGIASLNVIILFLLEYRNPNMVGHYYSNHDRIIDVYTALIYYGLIFYVFLTIIRDAYLAQYKKAKTADKLKSAFLANMSHEIRTPLNAIVGFSNLLADGTIKDEEKEQYVSIINTSSETLLQLIDDILDVSMIEANQVKINAEFFSVNDLMQNLKETYTPSLKKKKGDAVTLELQIPKDTFLITSDPIRINQVMINLLNNAVKFTEKGKISFGFSAQGEQLRFFVKDTGIGIEPSHINYLFDRFYKIEDDNKKLYRGTGIGLYLCKKITEMLGGSIHVRSEFGKGSEFFFFLPAKDLTVKPAITNIQHKETTESIQLPKGTVLIIEDDPSSRIYFKKVLEKQQIHILEASGGHEGVKIFRETPDISIVLLDIRLPGTSGFEILKELKKINPNVPVIAQTAFAMTGDREKCMAAGFTEYISKPVKKDRLIALLHKYI